MTQEELKSQLSSALCDDFDLAGNYDITVPLHVKRTGKLFSKHLSVLKILYLRMLEDRTYTSAEIRTLMEQMMSDEGLSAKTLEI